MAKNKKIPDSEYFQKHSNQPPSAIEAERMLLGALILDETAVPKVIALLKPEHFYDQKNSAIFEAMVALYEASEPIELLSLYEELKKDEKLEAAGGSGYIAKLSEDISSAANVETHARMIIEKWMLRQLIITSFDIASSAYEGREDVFDLLDQAESRVFSLTEESVRGSYQDMGSAVRDALEMIEAIHNKDIDTFSVPTHFYELDDMLGGLQKSDLIIVAARPSMGKTAFSLSLARNAAIEGKKAVAFFSLEMSTIQLATRLISAEARINAHSIRTGKFKAEEGAKISRTVHKLSKAPIYIDDTPALSILELRAKARRLKVERGIDLIIVDYLQLMSAGANMDSREREIALISRSLKSLAKELNIPVIALSQLNRSVESTSDKRPMLSHLRESGSIEQDADVVLFLYRPEVYEIEQYPDGDSTEGVGEVIIGKQRNGPIGEVKLQFIKEYARFENRELFTNQIPESASSQEVQPGEDFPI